MPRGDCPEARCGRSYTKPCKVLSSLYLYYTTGLGGLSRVFWPFLKIFSGLFSGLGELALFSLGLAFVKIKLSGVYIPLVFFQWASSPPTPLPSRPSQGKQAKPNRAKFRPGRGLLSRFGFALRGAWSRFGRGQDFLACLERNIFRTLVLSIPPNHNILCLVYPLPCKRATSTPITCYTAIGQTARSRPPSTLTFEYVRQ